MSRGRRCGVAARPPGTPGDRDVGGHAGLIADLVTPATSVALSTYLPPLAAESGARDPVDAAAQVQGAVLEGYMTGIRQRVLGEQEAVRRADACRRNSAMRPCTTRSLSCPTARCSRSACRPQPGVDTCSATRARVAEQVSTPGACCCRSGDVRRPAHRGECPNDHLHCSRVRSLLHAAPPDRSGRRPRPGRHGQQPGPQLRQPRVHRGVVQPDEDPHRRDDGRARLRGLLRPRSRRHHVPGEPGAPPPDHHDGPGRRRDGRHDRQPAAPPRAGGHRRRRRQRPLPGHPSPGGRAAREGPALRRRRDLRRRGGRAARARRSCPAAPPSPTPPWARCWRASPRRSTACRAAPTSDPTAPATS